MTTKSPRYRQAVAQAGERKKIDKLELLFVFCIHNINL